MIRVPVPLTMALVATSALCACSTLSRQVQTSAVEFSAVMEEFSNQVLVTNVLRARDRSPLNFSDLPAITGSLSLKTSATLTVPFGPRSPTDGRNSASPMIEFASTPTFDTTSLNTQAFTLGLMQPVSPVYVESIWNSGVSKSVLLLLFVESIQPPPGSNSEALYRNNPDDVEAFKRFKALVAEMTNPAHPADLHALTILEPVGLPIAIQAAPSPASAAASGAKAAAAPASQVALADIDVDKYLPLLQLEPNQFRTVVVKFPTRYGIQVYRRYPAQVVLCAGPEVFPADKASSGVEAGVLARQILGTNRQRMISAPPFELLGAPSSPRKPERSDSGGGFRGVSLSNGTSAVIGKDKCNGFEQIADAATVPVAQTQPLGHVRWRSTAEVFAYLGAVLRRGQSNPVAWGEGDRHILFNVDAATAVEPPRAARIYINYLGSLYAVGSRSETIPAAPPKIDHSLEVLSLLSQLVNAAKHSEDTPAPRTLQVLP